MTALELAAQYRRFILDYPNFSQKVKPTTTASSYRWHFGQHIGYNSDEPILHSLRKHLLTDPPFMSAEKTIAIVLRVIDFSETSCVVTLWTRDFGKITALAKGARRPKNPFEAALDTLAICRLVFIHKSSGAMDILTEAKLERRFRSASQNLKKLYAGYYVVELLSRLTEEQDPHPELFDLAFETIVAIEDADESHQALIVCLLKFEMGMFNELGLLPMLTQCVGCGRKRMTTNQVRFALDDGGIVCQNCSRGKSNVVNVSPAGMNLLLAISRAETPSIGPELTEIRKLMNRYVSHLLGFEPKLHSFLQNL